METKLSKDYEKKIDDIYTAIVGNKETGVRGLAHRVQTLEEYKKKDETLKMKIAGGLAVGTPLFVILWHWLLDLLHLGSPHS